MKVMKMTTGKMVTKKKDWMRTKKRKMRINCSNGKQTNAFRTRIETMRRCWPWWKDLHQMNTAGFKVAWIAAKGGRVVVTVYRNPQYLPVRCCLFVWFFVCLVFMFVFVYNIVLVSTFVCFLRETVYLCVSMSSMVFFFFFFTANVHPPPLFSIFQSPAPPQSRSTVSTMSASSSSCTYYTLTLSFYCDLQFTYNDKHSFIFEKQRLSIRTKMAILSWLFFFFFFFFFIYLFFIFIFVCIVYVILIFNFFFRWLFDSLCFELFYFILASSCVMCL